MSVKKTHGLACPQCGLDWQLEVRFRGTCRLTSEGSEDFGDHEWDDNSDCVCGCGFGGVVSDFRVSQPATETTGIANDVLLSNAESADKTAGRP